MHGAHFPLRPGSAAVRLAIHCGARVVAVASSAEKLAVARRHGADELIDSEKHDFVAETKRLTGGRTIVRIPSSFWNACGEFYARICSKPYAKALHLVERRCPARRAAIRADIGASL